MKSTVIVCVLISVIAFCQCTSIPAPNRGLFKGFCLTSKDCRDDNKCCASFDKEDINLHPSVKKLMKGKCEDLGNIGAECFTDPPSTKTFGLYFSTCLCRSGLTCEGTGQKGHDHTFNKAPLAIKQADNITPETCNAGNPATCEIRIIGCYTTCRPQ